MNEKSFTMRSYWWNPFQPIPDFQPGDDVVVPVDRTAHGGFGSLASNRPAIARWNPHMGRLEPLAPPDPPRAPAARRSTPPGQIITVPMNPYTGQADFSGQRLEKLGLTL